MQQLTDKIASSSVSVRFREPLSELFHLHPRVRKSQAKFRSLQQMIHVTLTDRIRRMRKDTEQSMQGRI